MADKGKRGLGRGMGALFGEDSSKTDGRDILTLPITKVEPRQDQPRCNFDDESLAELADSIRNYGLIQPITVRRLDSGYYQIVAGERRWRAARLAELKEVPVRVIEADDRRAMELALVENLQREDLNPIEEARGFRALMDEYGLTQEQAAASVGKSRPAVANSLRLLSLSPEVLSLVEEGELSAGHARALIPISSREIQLETAKTVIDGALSVRQSEELAAKVVRRLAQEEKASQTPEQTAKPTVDYSHEVEKALETVLGRKVKLVDGRKKGRIELEFYGAEDRERLIAQLRGLNAAKNEN